MNTNLGNVREQLTVMRATRAQTSIAQRYVDFNSLSEVNQNHNLITHALNLQIQILTLLFESQGTYRTGSCSDRNNGYNCNACDNANCASGYYRSGDCGGEQNNYVYNMCTYLYFCISVE